MKYLTSRFIESCTHLISRLLTPFRGYRVLFSGRQPAVLTMRVIKSSAYRFAFAGFLASLLLASSAFGWVGRFRTANGWHWQNPMPFDGSFHSVAMPSEVDVIIGGSYGVIIYSDDQGNSWTQANVPSECVHPVTSLAFLPESEVGFAISGGRLMSTDDAGQSWISAPEIEGYGAIFARDICSTGGSVYLLIDRPGEAQNEVLERISVEEGWSQPFRSTENFANLRRIAYPYFWNDSVIFRYSDHLTSGQWIIDVEPVPESETFVYVQGTTLRAADGSRLCGFETPPADICYSAPNILYAVSDHLLRSRNGGRSFEDLGDLYCSMHQVEFYDEATGFVVGDYSRALYTINNGNFWSHSITYRSEFDDLRNIYFVNDTLGYMQTSNCLEPLTLRSNNGGRNWTQIALCRRNLPDINKFWVHPEDNNIYILDGNGSFSRMMAIDLTAPQIIDENVRDFMFLNNTHGWYVTDTEIFATATSGLFWQLVSTLEGDSLRSVFFTSPQDGFVAGERGRILKTVNGGSRWFDVSVAGVDVNALWFFDANHGYAAGNEGVFFKTSDGGVHWQPRRTNSDNNIHSMRFWDEDHGYLALSDCLLVTQDGGDNFIRYESPLGFETGSDQKTPSICIRDRALTKFMYARGRCILDYDVNEVGISENAARPPASFELLSSYPNPFNGRISIRFSNPGATAAILNVFDIQGRLQDRLTLPPATGESLLTWDAGDNPSGTYILILEGSDWSASQKITLLR